MPQRAPSYYHWSMDKPCTTNQVYGFSSKGQTTDDYKGKKSYRAPNDHVRPFSNCGFFPQISYKTYMTVNQKGQPGLEEPSKRFNINKDYVMGYTPVTDKIVHSDVPAGFKLTRSVTVPPAYEHRRPKGKDLYLWHTLSGTLVHCKNYPPPVSASQ